MLKHSRLNQHLWTQLGEENFQHNTQFCFLQKQHNPGNSNHDIMLNDIMLKIQVVFTKTNFCTELNTLSQFTMLCQHQIVHFNGHDQTSWLGASLNVCMTNRDTNRVSRGKQFALPSFRELLLALSYSSSHSHMWNEEQWHAIRCKIDEWSGE